MDLDKKVIKMLRKEDSKISFQYVTMQITLGNIPDGKNKTNKQKMGAYFSVNKHFQKEEQKEAKGRGKILK